MNGCSLTKTSWCTSMKTRKKNYSGYPESRCGSIDVITFCKMDSDLRRTKQTKKKKLVYVFCCLVAKYIKRWEDAPAQSITEAPTRTGKTPVAVKGSALHVSNLSTRPSSKKHRLFAIAGPSQTKHLHSGSKLLID